MNLLRKFKRVVNRLAKHERVRNLSYSQKWLLQVLSISVVYFFVARLSLTLAFEQTNASPVWPPSAIGFAAVLWFGPRIWQSIMIGAILSNVFVFMGNHVAETPPILLASFLIGGGNVFEALLGAFLFRRFFGDRNPMDRVQDVFKFVFVVVLMCLAGSAVGPTAICGVGIVPWDIYQTVWITWWLGDISGILVLAPIFFAFYKRPVVMSWNRRHFLEFLLFLLLVYVTNMYIFDGPFQVRMPNYALAYVSIPLIVWVAFRFGQLGVGLVILAMLSVAISGTLQGFGPFVNSPLNEALLLLQSFIGVVTFTGLSLAAALNECKKTEHALRGSEERFHGIYNSSKDAIGYVNLDGVLLDVNDAFTKLTGYSKEELLNKKKFHDLTPPEYHEFEEKKIEELFRTGEPIEYEQECIRKDGLRVPVLLTTSLVRGPDDNIAGLAGIIRDLTEQKKAHEERFRLAAIVESTNEAIIGKTLDGIITSWNQGAERLYGYEAKEVIGKPASILVPPDRLNESKEIFVKLKRGERTEQFETVRVDKYGKMIDVALTISPIRDANNKIVGVSSVVHDITEHKRAEQKMQEAIRIKSEFTSTVSHELRTPLAIAKEAVSLIMREKVGKISVKQKEIIGISNSNLDRLGTLINDILDFSKIEAGKMDLHSEWTDVGLLVKSCCQEWRLQANVKHLKLECLVPNSPIIICVDKMRFLQILSNLLNNAIKFTPAQGRIEVGIEEKEDVCEFFVKDSGPGIASADLPHLFQKFKQLKRSQGPGARGTGLGLSIMKSLVELHGGKVWVESKLDEGTTFIFTIPRTVISGPQREKVAYVR